MVKAIAIVLCVVASATAAAEPDHGALGFTIGLGGLPLDGEKTFVYSLGLGIEHRAFAHWRAIAEYELLWLERQQMREYGDGHRAQVGLRHAIVHSQGSSLRWYVDAELGGGFGLVSSNLAPVRALPDAFVGVRGGYDMYASGPSQAQRIESALVVRAIAIPDGIGMLFGLSIMWGT